MAVYDKFLLINDFRPADSTAIKIWNIETGKVGKAAYIGRGPAEVIPPVFIQTLEDSIYIFSRGSRKLFSADIDGLKNENLLKLHHKYDFNHGLNRIITVNDSVNIAAGNFKEGMYAIFDKGKLYQYQGVYPNYWAEEKNISNSVKGIFHQPSLEFNKAENIIASSSRYILGLYNLTSDYDMELFSEELLYRYEYTYTDNESYISAQRKPLSVNGVLDRTSNSKHIYLLFDRNLHQSQEGKKLNYQIWVYDWKGNRKQVLEIAENVSFITVDQNDEYLYGLIELYNNTDSMAVVKYKLNN